MSAYDMVTAERGADRPTIVLDSPRVLRCTACAQTWHVSSAAAADDHPCVADGDYVAATGHCEDYPCCGHAYGECGDRAEFTAAYWSDLHDQMGDERYEAYCEALDRQEMGY